VAQSINQLSPNQYAINRKGDTINRTDEQGKKTGIWSVYHQSRYGDDSYYELGHYTDNKKHGNWKTYQKNGLLMNQTNYYNGFKNGEVKFYSEGRLVCKGQFKALRTDVPYDTIQVEQPNGDYKERVIPTSLGSVRHGFWVYYKPPFNEIQKIEEFQWDELVYEQDYATQADSLAYQSRMAKYPHSSGKLPPGIWGRKKGKAPSRFTDFPENTKFIKPNPGKKKH
jgi:hypothetical protein